MLSSKTYHQRTLLSQEFRREIATEACERSVGVVILTGQQDQQQQQQHQQLPRIARKRSVGLVIF